MQNINDLYNETGLSANMEDYMEAIVILSEKNKVVRVKDIAKSLSIKMPSVSAALNKLKDKGLIEYEKYGFIELTDEGKTVADSIYQRHSCLSGYYTEVLMLEGGKAEEEACKVEHQLQPETVRQIHKLVNFIRGERKKGSEWLKRMEKALK